MGETRRRSVFLSVLCLLLGATPVLAQTGSITGRLTGSDTGRPVVGAVVEAAAAGGRVAGSALSNSDGAFRITGLAAGTYTLSVAAVGYGTQAGGTAEVAAGATANVTIALEPRAFELNPLVVTSSRKAEKALEAPARVEVVTERDIDVRPALSPVDHLRSTPGVDVITSGLQSTNVVARGFNNIFSGALHTLTDNRIAGIPSLRVNLMHFVPQTNDDIQRMEVVLGPGSALYGPNTANGVLHIITKSPIDDPGSTVSVAGGERSVLHVTGRTALRVNDQFGFKVSGQYFQGNEWEYQDPVELAAKQLATTNFAAWAATQPLGLTQAELQQRAARLAARDFDISRYSVDARADWRPTPDLSAIFTAGRTAVGKGVELTGIGAGVVEDWMYGYYQARFNYRRWFAQAYLNTSDAGDTFLLRTGGPIVDKSKVAVAQLQHSADWRGLEFTYGGDFIRTTPETDGTINGSRENDDNYTEYGAYLQTKAALGAKLDLVVAGRGDWHSELADPVFSPRAALVIKPVADQTFRLTYNRAFSTPSSLNLFLDIDGGPAGPLGPLGFRVRAQGPGKDGITLTDASGMPLGLRSPFSGAPATLQNVTQQNLFDYQLNALLAQVPANLRPLLEGLRNPLKAGIGAVGIATLNPSTQAVAPLIAGSIADVPGIKPSISQTWEVGYKGLLADRLLLAADGWYAKQKDFTSPLVVRTPLLMLNPTQFGGYLQQNAAPAMVQALVASGMPLATAQATVTGLITNWVKIPAGVASSPDVAAKGSDLLATYVNFGEIDLWGVDLSAQWLMTDQWSATGTYSHTSDHNFCLIEVSDNTDCPEEELVALNAPKDKLSASLNYRGSGNGLSSEIRVRHTGEFPVNSADYVGLKCIGGGGEDCVESFTLFDVTLGYALPTMPGASLQLAITNILDEDYRSFVGVPKVGRLALLRLRYEF